MASLDDLIEIQDIFLQRAECGQILDEARREELQNVYDENYARYNELDKKLHEMLEQAGLDYDFETEKREFLENLVSTSHINLAGEDPAIYFEKLVSVYGERELANFSYTDYGSQYSELDPETNYDGMYEENNDYYTEFPSKTFTILDFMYGEEDKVIERVSDEVLRRQLLGSKLKVLQEKGIDIAQYIKDYASSVAKNNSDITVVFDEMGEVNINETLENFANLPISQDKNFYLYLATQLDEMEMPFETFLDYVDPNMMDSEFGPEICNARNTKQYEYQKEFAYRKPIDPALLAWLRGKDDELTSLEAEEKTITETEALIEKQTEKEGQDIGEN